LRGSPLKNDASTLESEELLVDKARSGNSEAFTELVNLHWPQIYRVSLNILRNHADAEDNAQDVLCKLYKNIHRFEGRSRFSTWLVRIAINEAYLKIRSRTSKPLLIQVDMSSASAERSSILQIEDDSPDPERQCLSAQLASKALDGMHPLIRQMFTLHIASGWTHRELACAIGITVATAKSRIFRARGQMQQRLTEHC
jgi:RNA polymerase sigma-70 factor, ECF subfamily